MATRNGDSMPEKIRRHDSYYIMTGDIVFLVEHHLFRVHRYFFERESPVFREKLALATPPGQSPRGTSDANPFPIEDATSVDFSRFLWVFYNPLYSLYNASIEEWTSILKLAYLWRFAEVKKLAVRELEKQYIAPVPKIALYNRYDVDRNLLLPSYSVLTTRDEPISMAEGMDLGLETSLLLARARELARGKEGRRASSPVTIEDSEVQGLLTDVFALKDVPFRPTSPAAVRVDTSAISASNTTAETPTGTNAPATPANGLAAKLFGAGAPQSQYNSNPASSLSPGAGAGWGFSAGQNPKSPTSTTTTPGARVFFPTV
ncbi:hypothetical protein GLOTRDRAFT_76535 [Gloeophyllum trabeum ATCC 11539]|uniref:BTB domain-containing protein n=1 Tax=Gloeophyllum trabeum (strain ATCC 11539 / FP-39264 / Madison 617) TaxID=670483 RepID=S7RLE1_GLOTA|nr:uncharacterized protein GLOTRDRAFT_76535 [Gloeophyllum trabeum ATCC 11539]EPQ55220.1 hypothetical protein GLOTRDRAFT_76535 [Gloeophyllum trabeum ATCC 11539]